MPDLISLVGGESTGKSTLARALGRSLDAIVVAEFLRTWVDERDGRVPLPAEQAEVLAGQRHSEQVALESAARAGRNWVVSDSGPLMTAVYSIQYYGDDSLLAPALAWTARSAHVVWCQDDFPWQPDPQRDGSHARAESQQILGAIFAEHPELPVLPVRGAVEERVQTIESELSRGLGLPGRD